LGKETQYGDDLEEPTEGLVECLDTLEVHETDPELSVAERNGEVWQREQLLDAGAH
jgi:hypothetical protein